METTLLHIICFQNNTHRRIFGVIKRLGWVEVTDKTEPSAIYPAAPERVYYRLTKVGKQAGQELWSNPLFML